MEGVTRRVIKKERVQLATVEGREVGGPAGRAPEKEVGPRLALLRAGGRIEALQVTCACGESVLVELEIEGQEAAGERQELEP